MDSEQLRAGMSKVRRLAGRSDWLAIVITTTPAGRISTSLVNTAPFEHPRTGAQTIALVAYGDSAKLRNIRANPRVALTYTSSWDWITVHGRADIIGPDDPDPTCTGPALSRLLRDIYAAAGGSHADLDEYDAVMIRERRAAVFVTPTRFATN